MGQGESILCNFAERAPMPKGIENPEKEELRTTTTTTTSLFLTLNIQISHHLQIARLIEAGGV